MKDLSDLHFVSFDTAILLEEAGYNEESLVVYKYNTQTKDGAELTCLGSPKKNIHLKDYSTVAAITLDEACDFIRNQYMHVLVAEPKYENNYDDYDYSIPSRKKTYRCGPTADTITAGIKIEWTTYLRDDRALNSPFNIIAKNKDKYAALDEGINVFLRTYILDKYEIGEVTN